MVELLKFSPVRLPTQNKQSRQSRSTLTPLVFCSYDHHLVLTTAGVLYAGGTEISSTEDETPVSVAINDSCRTRALILTANGHVYVVGLNLYYRPKWHRHLPLEGVIKVFAGANYGLALTVSGQIYVWGTDFRGQLGLGNYAVVVEPTQVSLPEPITQVVIGQRTGALSVSGRVYIWGKEKNYPVLFPCEERIETLRLTGSTMEAVPGMGTAITVCYL